MGRRRTDGVWRKELAGIAELSAWADVSPAAITNAIGKDPTFPEPLDTISAATVYHYPSAVAALEALGFTEGGGPRKPTSG